MTTKSAKTSKAKQAATLHLALPGKGSTLCGAKGKTAPADSATCAECKKIAAHAEEKAKATAPTAAPATKPVLPAASKAGRGKAKTTPASEAPAPSKAQPGRDPRLPPVGTVLTKKDRHGAVRCEVTITEAGFVYKGQEFGSLSGAAMAAAKDQGTAGAVNGYLYFGLATQRRVTDPVEALAHAWERFHEKAASAFTCAGDDEAALAKLKAALAGQVKQLERLAQRTE